MAGDDSPTADAGPASALPLSPRARSSLLWGVVGGLSFLVLVQGYELVGDLGVGIGIKIIVALVVAAVATLLTYAAGARLP
ncbi:hypothetical protein [Halosimplex sp. J119]